MNKIVYILFFLMLSGCFSKKGKGDLFVKSQICNNLIREKYLKSSGGAYSAETFADYITDSSNFRKFVGTHTEHQSISYECKGDSIIAVKVTYEDSGEIKKIWEKYFSNKELLAEKIFE